MPIYNEFFVVVVVVFPRKSYNLLSLLCWNCLVYGVWKLAKHIVCFSFSDPLVLIASAALGLK